MSPKSITKVRRCQRAAALAAITVGLGTASQGAAGEPAARLLPPLLAADTIPSVIQRASGEELAPNDSEPAPVAPTRERDRNFKYPTPYSKSEGGLFDIAAFWKHRDDEKVDETEQNSGIVEQMEPMAIAKGTHLYNQQVGPVKTQAMSASAPAPPSPQVPAWRWFGYGAPVPGRNVYAPDGVYAPVHPNYYHQTGATPGAIPGPLQPAVQHLQAPKAQPDLPTLPPPIPNTSEPPKLMSRPVDAPATVQEPMPDRNVLPAKMELPIPAASPEMPGVGVPLSANLPAAVMRGQAPDEEPLSAVSACLSRECTGYATLVEIMPKGPSCLCVRITLASRVQADRLAKRISQLPEMAGYDVELQFVR